MGNIEWSLEKRDINSLKPYANNPRNFTEKGLEDLGKSLDNIGMAQALNITKDGVVLSGNARLSVLKNKGVQYVDAYVPNRELTEAEQQEVVIRMNANQAGEWDNDLLEDNFDKEDLQEWGLDDIEWSEEEPTEGLTDDDEVPEVTEEPIAQKGDIWLLGDHRLMCGDSTDPADVALLMNGNKADMVFTDPPYGMKKENEGVLNDNLNYNDLLEFNKKWIPLSFDNVIDVGSWYCWGIDEPLMDIYSVILKPMIAQQKATFRNLLTWDKGTGQGQMWNKCRSYARADEKCLFMMKGVQGFNNNADNYFEGWELIRLYLVQEKEKLGLTNKELTKHLNTAHTHYWATSQWRFPAKEHYTKLQELGKANKIDAFKKEYDEIKKEYDEIKEEYYSTRVYFDNTHNNMNNVWHFARHQKDGSEGGHATPKPIDLCSRAIISSSPKSGSVLDLFGGSGSTLIACEKTDRKCYMMELDPHYVDVIIKRWEDYTGNKAELLEK